MLKKFSIKELENSLKNHENTSPGVDIIHYIMLYNPPLNTKMLMLEILNNIWESSTYPESWKQYILIAIQKPHSDPEMPESYRGIFLASCILKTFERMVKTRLEWWLEANKKLAVYQFGLRKAHCVNENICRLTTDINTAFS